jgi:hypothetical protein
MVLSNFGVPSATCFVRRLVAVFGVSFLVAGLVGCGSSGDAKQAAAGGGPESAVNPAPPAGSASTEQPSTVSAPPVSTARLQDLSFDDVKFEMEKGDPFTTDLLPGPVASLEGQRIRIRGYILPSFQQEGITQFVLVRDNMECCFGPGAALYDCIVVRMLPGRSTNFSVRPVSGTFHVEELIGPDGRHLAIYSLDGEDVE